MNADFCPERRGAGLPNAALPDVFHVPPHEAIKGSAVKFELSERLVYDWKRRAGEEVVGGADAEHIQNCKERQKPWEQMQVVATLFVERLRWPGWRFARCLRAHVASLTQNFSP
jgi:hypothetical protein